MTTSSVSLFLGPDRFRKRERIRLIGQELHVDALDRHEVQAGDLRAGDLAILIREYPALSPLRLVVIDEAQRLDQGCLELLTQHATSTQAVARVILLVDIELGKRQGLGGLTAAAQSEHFPWLSDQELGRWIQRYGATHQKQIAPGLIGRLQRRHGADLAAIGSVLDQLIDWVGGRPQLTEQDLDAFLPDQASGASAAGYRPAVVRGRMPVRTSSHGVLGKSARSGAANRFALLDAIGRRDGRAALLALHERLMEGSDPLELLGMLVWQLQRWLTTKHLVEAGLSAGQVATRLGLEAWQVHRLLNEVKPRSIEGLREALSRCWEFDVAAKRGLVPNLRAGCEQVVLDLCRWHGSSEAVAGPSMPWPTAA